MSDFWKKPRKTAKERIEDRVDDVKDRARKDDSGDPIVYMSNRSHRRYGSGQPRSRLFGEKMKIPKPR